MKYFTNMMNEQTTLYSDTDKNSQQEPNACSSYELRGCKTWVAMMAAALTAAKAMAGVDGPQWLSPLNAAYIFHFLSYFYWVLLMN